MTEVDTHQRPGELIARAVKILRATAEVTYQNTEARLTAVNFIRCLGRQWRVIFVRRRKQNALYLMQQLIDAILVFQWRHQFSRPFSF